MTDAERMYAIKEAARKIVEAMKAEGLAFVSAKALGRVEQLSGALPAVNNLRERDDVLKRRRR